MEYVMTDIDRIRRKTSYKTLVNKIKDNFELKCYYCGESVTKKRCTVDHLIPLCRGGQHAPQNLRISCKKCNCEKGQMTDEEYRKFKGLPTPPSFTYDPAIFENNEILTKKELVFDDMLQIEKINVPWLFMQNSVRKEKLKRAMRYYELYNFLDRTIVLDDNNYISNGYIGYVVAQLVGLKEVPVVYENKC